ncbi:molybdenum cofactor guanylyltransferase [Acetobacter sp.]|jgi:molybdopterin-guanine dinucleotide biosynthesis protein A|uniref:molybdenum cofactor guanylyltransferase n=1 Tax=Acetobacter sp. TaxID=440 RepID=UPI0025C5B047|nr:molybdenum cofactor guanylyltransferase [Acetobacter sp.]MCH4092337.1 molybdenum cofactor guanylyltransferase [Acetobacter sp.]MCI1300987.1 molybdenum cofactor guanylyltransferase [Acetobacter sp.]MCI1317241.1 molybdenum cofactor guanylyltransferase [Acetobacter sp.]
MSTAGLVLAGGQGSRMQGRDKAFLDINGINSLTHVFSRLHRQCAAIAISANGDSSRFREWSCPVLADRLHDIGPLAGLLSGLEWAETSGYDTLVTVPVDTPFIPSDLVISLLPAPSFASWNGEEHPLVAAWPVSCRSILARQLADAVGEAKKRNTRVRTLARSIAARAVDFGRLSGGDPFMNINTPEDLIAAQNRNETESRNP